MNLMSIMSKIMRESKSLGLYPSKSHRQQSIDSGRTVSKSELNKDHRRRTEQGRNEMCSCGSLKKFKNCHGKVINKEDEDND